MPSMFSKSFSAFRITIATFSSLTQNKILNKRTEVEEKMSVYEESFNKTGFYTTKSSYSQIIHVWYRNITDPVVQYPPLSEGKCLTWQKHFRLN